MAIQRVLPLGALGVHGQNTQDQQIDLPPSFATSAINAVVDESGRLAARKSATLYSAANGDLGSNSLKRCYRHNLADGSSQMISAGNNRIFTGSSTLTSRLSGGTADRWQFATLNGKLFAAQASHNFTWFDESTWAATTIATPAMPNTIHSAFGRLWAGDITSNNYTLYWSDLLDGTNFAGGASGSLDLSKAFTNFRDRIVAVNSFDKQIIVFCRNSIYILGLNTDLNPNDPTNPIRLVSVIPNIGTIGRDSVVSTGEDILFMSDDGLRSLKRSLAEQQGPAPMTDVSALNHSAIGTNVVRGVSNTADITAAFWPRESWYMLFVQDTMEIWLFDLGNMVPGTQIPRTTVWRMGATRPVYHGLFWTDGVMYLAGKSGMYDYIEYDSTDSYTFEITTGWMSFGDGSLLKHLKRLILNLVGGAGQDGILKWYIDFDETLFNSTVFEMQTTGDPDYYNIDQYEEAEYSSGISAGNTYVSISGSGNYFKLSIEIPVVGSAVALNNALVAFTMGRTR